jgi:hypothetical protein
MRCRPRPWQGVDCSNYVAWIYNFAFGKYYTSSIGPQACSPSQAPGLITPFSTAQQDQFQPGERVHRRLPWQGRGTSRGGGQAP